MLNFKTIDSVPDHMSEIRYFINSGDQDLHYGVVELVQAEIDKEGKPTGVFESILDDPIEEHVTVAKVNGRLLYQDIIWIYKDELTDFLKDKFCIKETQ